MSKIALDGRHVRLEPYVESLKAPLRAALDCDADGWQLFALSAQGAHFDGWWNMVDAEAARGDWIAYAIRDRATDAIVGTTSFLNIKRTRQCVEIGGTFLHPDVRSTLGHLEKPPR